jgi:Enoyl-CoA hydratase/isomerase
MKELDTPYQTLDLGAPAPGVAVVTLNRPDRYNAMTATMFDEPERAATALDDEDDLRAVIITGAGKAFCAGYDLADAGELPKLSPLGMLPSAAPATGRAAGLTRWIGLTRRKWTPMGYRILRLSHFLRAISRRGVPAGTLALTLPAGNTPEAASADHNRGKVMGPESENASSSRRLAIEAATGLWPVPWGKSRLL